jgi:hypothetical protein
MDSRPDFSDATASAAHDRQYLLTHTMEIRRVNGAEFSIQQSEWLLEHLRITFSFAFGHWVSPVLPRGYDSDDQVVWERWSSPICDPFRKVAPGWFYSGRPEDLAESVSCAVPSLADSSRLGATRLQMQQAVSAVDSGFVEQRIMSAAPALENLGWTRLVGSGRWTDREYENRFP